MSATLTESALCACGCGEPAPIAKQTKTRQGHVKGRPQRFCHGHSLRRHGHTSRGYKSPTYHSWAMMLARTMSPTQPGWKHYGGRGITVCDRWREPDGQGFLNFLEDMGERPEDKTLDRIDPDGNYEPGNCRWATRSEQARNKRKP